MKEKKNFTENKVLNAKGQILMHLQILTKKVQHLMVIVMVRMEIPKNKRKRMMFDFHWFHMKIVISNHRRKPYLRTSGQLRTIHLKKYLIKKLNLPVNSNLQILCNGEIIGKEHSLLYIKRTRWHEIEHLTLHYRLNEYIYLKFGSFIID